MSSHDEGHVERVMKLAEFIARREGADLEVVLTAARLHDIARDAENHAVESAKKAREILKGRDYKFVSSVVHAIEAHSFSSGIEPRTLEAKVLSDADKLDAMGAIGVARAFLYSGERGRSIHDTLKHFEEKLLRLKDQLYTDTAREIAEDRHRFLELFYARIKRELDEF
ncbi:HD domain-containing protein [Archaeoglobus neptunius]|uniref:HD domain-containing protein n=1 Tax=Archaeoglobus neptunius TaxID=2798580 RepID=UPI0019275F77|nr:HD domain-containing protein [Archaeoglobus neptunius]